SGTKSLWRQHSGGSNQGSSDWCGRQPHVRVVRIVAGMVDVVPCADEADEQASLDVYNAVWPHDAITMDEVRHFKASVTERLDLLARIDGEVAGSGCAASQPQRPELVLVKVPGRAAQRRR